MQNPLKRIMAPAIKIVILIYSISGMGCDKGPISGKGFRVENGKPAIVSSAPFERVVRHIPGADTKTFKSLDNAKDAQATYAVDGKRVYIGYWNHAMPIDSADPTTFSIITTDGAYAKDKERVYWFGVELEGADPATFRILEEPYAVDGSRAYAGIIPFEVHSLGNFEVLQVNGVNRPIGNRGNRLVTENRDEAYVSGWSRDGIAYYWGGTELKGADYDSLTILNDRHAKDSKSVFYRGALINGADAESFVVIRPGSIRGHDRNFEYKLGKRIGRAKQPN